MDDMELSISEEVKEHAQDPTAMKLTEILTQVGPNLIAWFLYFVLLTMVFF